MWFVFILIILGLITVIAILLMIKTIRTGYLRNKIIKAIGDYNQAILISDTEDMTISYDCLEPYYKSWLRLNDWSIKNIIPSAIYEKIKPFL